jgi:hypothetical protein
MARKYREVEIQKELCRYISLKYPKVIFNCDCSGLNLSKTQAGQASVMRSDLGFPDFVMYEPRKNYFGLFIEIKREGETLYKKHKSQDHAGILWKDDHVFKQYEMIVNLQKKGYFASFGIGLDDCMKIVDTYLL